MCVYIMDKLKSLSFSSFSLYFIIRVLDKNFLFVDFFSIPHFLIFCSYFLSLFFMFLFSFLFFVTLCSAFSES